MKKLRKILFFVIMCFTLSGCSDILYPQEANLPGYRKIVEYDEQMGLLKTNFPEIYDLYRQGIVTLVGMYVYNDENGKENVHITYRYITPSTKLYF